MSWFSQLFHNNDDDWMGSNLAATPAATGVTAPGSKIDAAVSAVAGLTGTPAAPVAAAAPVAPTPVAPAPYVPSAPDPWIGILQGQLQDQTAALRQSAAASEAANALALQTQKEANAKTEAASVPTIDSESARSARDAQQRRLMSGSNFGIGLSKKLGAPPTGFRVLSGS